MHIRDAYLECIFGMHVRVAYMGCMLGMHICDAYLARHGSPGVRGREAPDMDWKLNGGFSNFSSAITGLVPLQVLRPLVQEV